jgi:hypothetical protein
MASGYEWAIAMTQITFFQDQKAQTLTTDDLPLERIKALVLGTHAKDKAQLPWLKLAIFGNRRSEADCLRHDANVKQITGIEMDYDAQKVPLEQGIKIAKQHNLRALFYTSPSHKKSAPKWRLIVPTSQPLPPETRRPLAEYINKLFGGIFARESLTLSQAYYFGYINKVGHRCEIVKGDYIDLANPFILYDAETKPVDIEKLLAAMAPGNIHNTQLSVTGSMVNAGIPIDDIVAKVLAQTKIVGKTNWNWKKEERHLRKMCEKWYANQEEALKQSQLHQKSGKVYEDFIAYLPDHTYYFLPTREAWPATSVDSQLKPKLKVNGKAKPVFIPAHTWLDTHRAVDQMVWAPGEDIIIKDKLIDTGSWTERIGSQCFNLYKPPVIELGDASKAKPWLELLTLIYPDDKAHIINYLAQRVQQPAIKINHGLVLGGAPGIGKDTILEGLKHAVGPWNFTEIAPTHLLGQFNGYIKSVVLRISEARDMGEINRYSFYEHTKTLMCAPPDVLRCNEKFTHEHAVFNVSGVILTTNHKTTGLYLPEDDRRHYVAWSEIKKEDFKEGYWREIWGWYYDGGFEAVAAYLHNVDLIKFDPKEPPIKTKAFWDIVDAGRAPEESEAADAIDKLGKPAAVTLDMLIIAADYDFATWLQDRKNRRAIPHRMETIGYIAYANPYNAQRVWSVYDAKTKTSKRQIVYVRKELPVKEQHKAAQKLCEPST